MLIDQNAGDHGVWVPFFGRLTSTSPLAAMLAVHTDALLVPVAVFTVGTARWRLVVAPVIEPGGRSVQELTAELTASLERQIRASPADWLWSHNRWKTPPGFLPAAGRCYIPEGVVVQPFRVLVVAPAEIPAALALAGLPAAIHHARPDAHVTVMTGALLRPIWEGPGVDRIVDCLPSGELFDVALTPGGRCTRRVRRMALAVYQLPREVMENH